MTFGRSYLLDLYACRPGTCDDIELNYRFLELLVEKLGMHPMAPPTVIHAPRHQGVELYPDKAGISGWQPLIESGIQVHAIEPTHFCSLDVYSCKPFDPKIVLEFARDTYGFQIFHDQVIERGLSYPSGKAA